MDKCREKLITELIRPKQTTAWEIGDRIDQIYLLISMENSFYMQTEFLNAPNKKELLDETSKKISLLKEMVRDKEELYQLKKDRESEKGRSCGNCIFFKKPKTLNDAGRCKNESIINCIGCEGGFAFYCDDNFYCKYWKPTETKGAGVSEK